MASLPLYKGIDLSYHQRAGKVNFDKMKGYGYSFVMLRAGYGKVLGQKDKAFESHYANARAAGLKVGAYIYSYATTVKEAEQEAECFLSWIDGKKLEYPVAFDIEDKCQKKLSKEMKTMIAIAFMSKVEEAGYYTMLYSSASWLGSQFNWSMKYRGYLLSHFDVWCAAYVGSESNIKKYFKGRYGMWQYTSSLINKAIYKSRLDHNYAYKDYYNIIKRNRLNPTHREDEVIILED